MAPAYSLAKTSIKSVTANGTDVTVVMLSNLESDTVHYVQVGNSSAAPLSFKAVGGSEMDIAKVEVTNTKVLYNTMADLGLKFYNAEGVDITNNVKDKVLVEITNAEQNVYDAYASGTQVYFSLPNKVHYFNISVLKEGDKSCLAANSESPNFITSIFFGVRILLKPGR